MFCIARTTVPNSATPEDRGSQMRRLACLLPALTLLGATGAQAGSLSYYLDQTNGEPHLTDGVNYLQVTISDATLGLDTDAIRFDVSVLGPLSSIADTGFGIQSFGFNTLLSPASVLAAITGLPGGKPLRQCIGSTGTLAQFEHRGRKCSQRVVRDGPFLR